MKPITHQKVIIIGNTPDCYFAIDLADFLGQSADIADLISHKVFANSEFCPRFTVNGSNDIKTTGRTLEGRVVIIVSVHSDWISRNELAARNLILARAAKDNGARKVVLVEPDLFYAAQDRGPGKDQGILRNRRTKSDLHRFNGQPFTARLYAQMLKTAGVDVVITIHNHSISCEYEYKLIFGPSNFINLYPDHLYHSYLCNSGIVDPYNAVLVAPDEGAMDFVRCTAESAEPFLPFVFFEKIRYNERTVQLHFSDQSQLGTDQIEGKEVVVVDDMVRTGSTVLNCCKMLSKYNPKKIIFLVTHFLSSDEIKSNLGHPSIHEIITTNTLPTILNRDNQGRLRKKMAVLKINKWIARYLSHQLGMNLAIEDPLYLEDMSDKNPRVHRKSEFSVFV